MCLFFSSIFTHFEIYFWILRALGATGVFFLWLPKLRIIFFLLEGERFMIVKSYLLGRLHQVEKASSTFLFTLETLRANAFPNELAKKL